MRVVTSTIGGWGESSLPIGRYVLWTFALILSTTTSTSAGISPSDCARAAKYSESRRGVSMLVMDNGRIIFEHYANGGSTGGRWPIFSRTKNFWGIAALAAV